MSDDAMTVFLRCVRCDVSGWFPSYAETDGLPIAQAFAERGNRCKECYRKSLVRANDPTTSTAGAKNVLGRSGSQRHLLLLAYTDGAGLTADEAMRRSGVPDRSCYWKRISELREAGLIEDTGEERAGEQGSAQMVCRITAAGLQAVPERISA